MRILIIVLTILMPLFSLAQGTNRYRAVIVPEGTDPNTFFGGSSAYWSQYSATQTVNMGGNSITNAGTIYDTNNTAIAGTLYTNYTINIPTTWTVQDIEDAVARVPPSIRNRAILTLDWDDGTHVYTTNTLNLNRIFKGIAPAYSINAYNYTNHCNRIVGNPENPSACKLQFSNTGGENNGIVVELPISINGFTVVATNTSRANNGIHVRNSAFATVVNCIVSNWANGFVVNHSSAMLGTNNVAINCDNGYASLESGSKLTSSGVSIATNCTVGFYCYLGASLSVAGSKANNCQTGYKATDNATILASSTVCFSNQYAYYSTKGSFINADVCATPTNCTYEAWPYWDTSDADGSTVYRYGKGTTINIGGIDTWDKLTNVISSLGRNLNDNIYNINCTSNTFTFTAGIDLQDYYGGQIDILGTNNTAYANATNQATIFDCRSYTSPLYCIRSLRNACTVGIRGVKIFPPNATTATALNAQAGGTFVLFINNSVVGTNAVANYGITTLNGITVRAETSVFYGLSRCVNPTLGSFVLMNNCNTTNTLLPAYAGYVQSGGRLQVSNANTNYPASTASWYQDTGGLIVTNVGKILP